MYGFPFSAVPFFFLSFWFLCKKKRTEITKKKTESNRKKKR